MGDLGAVTIQLLPVLADFDLLEEQPVHLGAQRVRAAVPGQVAVPRRGLRGSAEVALRQAVARELQLLQAPAALHELDVEAVVQEIVRQAEHAELLVARESLQQTHGAVGSDPAARDLQVPQASCEAVLRVQGGGQLAGPRVPEGGGVEAEHLQHTPPSKARQCHRRAGARVGELVAGEVQLRDRRRVWCHERLCQNHSGLRVHAGRLEVEGRQGLAARQRARQVPQRLRAQRVAAQREARQALVAKLQGRAAAAKLQAGVLGPAQQLQEPRDRRLALQAGVREAQGAEVAALRQQGAEALGGEPVGGQVEVLQGAARPQALGQAPRSLRG
mmetsp:Transcript_83837/g.234170  ORF Transcript_83837/g.234170 Transcript_83837/m.234170 type:complete len:331 (+) Transcript_83837:367-1359(+)